MLKRKIANTEKYFPFLYKINQGLFNLHLYLYRSCTLSIIFFSNVSTVLIIRIQLRAS